MEIFAIKGGGIRRLMADAISNFHFFGIPPLSHDQVTDTKVLYGEAKRSSTQIVQSQKRPKDQYTYKHKCDHMYKFSFRSTFSFEIRVHLTHISFVRSSRLP